MGLSRESGGVGIETGGGGRPGCDRQSQAAVYLAPGPEDLEVLELERPSENQPPWPSHPILKMKSSEIKT